MIRSRHIRRFWLWVGIGLLIELAVLTLWKRPNWFFSRGEVSEYYTRYAGTPGINAAFVKDYRVNDTLLLDVTVLEVTDSAVWEQICEDLHLLTTAQIPKEYLDFYLEPGGFESYLKQDTVIENGLPRLMLTFFVYSRHYKTVCIFHNITQEQYGAIMDSEVEKI